MYIRGVYQPSLRRVSADTDTVYVIAILENLSGRARGLERGYSSGPRHTLRLRHDMSSRLTPKPS